MELILGGVDLDAATAERWGYLNRAFADVGELDRYVDDLARRIASYPPEAVALAKAAVLAAEPDWHQGLVEEAYLFQKLLRTPEARPAMQAFLDAGGQTRDGELRVGELNAEVGRRLSGG
jgi:enoyl-CoA hydratase/carnithine racemase